MDHNYAVENHVAEGYLLDDLDEAERDAYEDHYFGCTKCAEEVEMVSEFMDTAKQVIRDELKPQPVAISAPSAGWLSRFMPAMRYMPATAYALLALTAGIVVYQYQIIRHPVHPPIATVVTEFTLSSSHASTDVIKTSRGNQVLLKFSIPPSGAEDFSSYDVDIVTNSGSKKVSLNIPKAQANDPQLIELETGDLESGTYFLVIRGVNRNRTESGIKGDLDRIAFELELQ